MLTEDSTMAHHCDHLRVVVLARFPSQIPSLVIVCSTGDSAGGTDATWAHRRLKDTSTFTWSLGSPDVVSRTVWLPPGGPSSPAKGGAEPNRISPITNKELTVARLVMSTRFEATMGMLELIIARVRMKKSSE